MKKIIAFTLALLLLLSLGACKVETGAASSNGTSSTPASVDPADYSQDLSGLTSCLQAAGYIAGDPVEMEASFIGAAHGRRYTFDVNKSAVTVELYEYDEAAAADSEVLKSVDETGSFTIFDNEVEAIHVGRYLLIYTDASNKDLNTARRDAVVEMFTAFASL